MEHHREGSVRDDSECTEKQSTSDVLHMRRVSVAVASGLLAAGGAGELQAQGAETGTSEAKQAVGKSSFGPGFGDTLRPFQMTVFADDAGGVDVAPVPPELDSTEVGNINTYLHGSGPGSLTKRWQQASELIDEVIEKVDKEAFKKELAHIQHAQKNLTGLTNAIAGAAKEIVEASLGKKYPLTPEGDADRRNLVKKMAANLFSALFIELPEIEHYLAKIFEALCGRSPSADAIAYCGEHQEVGKLILKFSTRAELLLRTRLERLCRVTGSSSALNKRLACRDWIGQKEEGE